MGGRTLDTAAYHMEPPTKLVRMRWIIISAWTLAVAASLVWNLVRQEQVTRDLAYTEAETLYKKDLLYRRWASNHGGVYVPVTPETRPNAYLKIPERDISTPSGKLLTLVNPAYMGRQVYELARQSGEPQGHITSLKPLRPANRADPWEEEALQAFERGQLEVSAIEMLDDQSHLRLMRPFPTEVNCLNCHAGQGYKEGDIRGGISLVVPMNPLWQAGQPLKVTLGVGHGFLWLLGVIGITFGFSRLAKSEEQIIAMMCSDSLTNLANRRFFLDILDKAMSFAARHQQPLSLIMADLDYFKAVNDNFGHDAGDRVLQAFSILMLDSLRMEDLPSRYGGEEFLIMLPGTTAQQAAGLAERLRQSLESLKFAGIDRPVTASFGVSQFLPGDTAETVTKRANEALYAAKELGRNQVKIRYDQPQSH
jgi:diguanylate cyclase (GGDEF)-like protein